ncbi:MAG TPA: hypothetical protein VKW06_17580 [Candidatus Angelobacter sp.]|nr:hypothetical protein [Candidatus Angelobacter sp.]
MGQYLEALREWMHADEDWQPLPRWAIAAWSVFFLLFLVYSFSKHGGFLFIDSANLVVHEGGHLLFGWFGRTLGLWGGTILQWLVPLLLAATFYRQRQPAGFVFCLFFFFENWLYTATYMADARAMALPLVTTGDPDLVEHDWNTIFTTLGLLRYDTAIATAVRLGGWAGMIGSVVWLVLRGRNSKTQVELGQPRIMLNVNKPSGQ